MAGVFDFMGPVDWSAPAGEMKKEGAVEVYNSLDILKKYPDKEVDTWVDRDSDCLMQYTGGTTGPSKGAVLTNRNISHQVSQWVTWTDGKIGEEVGVSAFPLFHLAGLLYAYVGLSIGMTQVLIPNPRDVAFIVNQVKKYRPTIVANVPTLFMEMMKNEDFQKMDLSFVKWYGSGAAPFPAELIKQFYEIVGDNKLVEVYGMTETSPLITAQPFLGKKKVGSVGLPLPDTDVILVDPATGEIAKLGEPGELCARGPQIMRGYHKKPEETANSIRDGYMHTGDVATMDEDGFFFIVDRLKDMVSVSGMKVFTRELDEIIAQHPDIEMCASVGVPDPDRAFTEIVASAVVLKPGVEANDAAKQVHHQLHAREGRALQGAQADYLHGFPAAQRGRQDTQARTARDAQAQSKINVCLQRGRCIILALLQMKYLTRPHAILLLLITLAAVLCACAQPLQEQPAAFEMVSLGVAPSQVLDGQEATVTAQVANTGGLAGNFKAELTSERRTGGQPRYHDTAG